MKKIVIINTSNLKKGGALQVAKSFIFEAQKYTNIDFHVILGKTTNTIINQNDFSDIVNIAFHTVDIYPTDSIFSFFEYKRKLKILEHKIKPSFVISVFGPCYWRPMVNHIIGFANGYYLYEDSPFFKICNLNKGFLFKLIKKLQILQLKYEADLYWLETNDAKLRFTDMMKISSTMSIVTSNAASFYFSNSHINKKIQLPLKNKIRLLYVSSYYIHKNFEIIPLIHQILLQRGYDTEFLITISDSDYSNNDLLVNCDGIYNIGSVDPDICPYLYSQTDFVFVPSLLETFTAIYPEAMISQKPIITTDLDFAKSICCDAALYYKYDNAYDAATKIISLIEDRFLVQNLISKGLCRLTHFDTGETRFLKILNKINSCTFSD